jgi:hypothetical protein
MQDLILTHRGATSAVMLLPVHATGEDLQQPAFLERRAREPGPAHLAAWPPSVVCPSGAPRSLACCRANTPAS